MLRDAELAEGGNAHELVHGGRADAPYAFDQRACDRLATLRALEALTEEVRSLTPQNAFESGYLRREAKADQDDDDVDERVVERRRKRREEREARYVKGEGDEIASAAKDAALSFLEESRPASNVSIVLALLNEIRTGSPRSGSRSCPRAIRARASRSARSGPRRASTRRGRATPAPMPMHAWRRWPRDESPYHIRGGEL